jgi:hypothetical protein
MRGGDGPSEILGEAGIVRLVDLEIRGAGPGQLAQLDVHHPRDVEGERRLGGIVLVADALDEGVRPGDAHLGATVGEAAQEAKVGHQPQRSRGETAAHHAVVEIVVVGLGMMVDLDAGQPLREVIDHVVAPELTIGHHVDTRRLLILDGGLDGGVVHLVQVVAGDAPTQEVVLGPLEPAGERIAADDGGGQHGTPHSRWVVYSVEVREPGR